MRTIFPLVALGFVLAIILGIIGAGLIMLGYGLKDAFDKEEVEKQPTPKIDAKPPQQPQGKIPPKRDSRSLLAARRDFETRVGRSEAKRPEPRVRTVANADIVRYDSPAGPLAAYLSKGHAPGKKLPTVIWVHKGFDGIDPITWKQAEPFLDAGLVVMCPSFRGENGNPGQFEMFYGEVGDLLAAVDFAAKLPYVDSKRIYVAGHRAGGTLALLAATTGTVQVRAFFAIGGTPNLEEFFRVNAGRVTPSPFDRSRPQESYLRSAQPFVGSIERPTFYFEASVRDLSAQEGKEMEAAAGQRVPFRALIIPKANVDTLADPIIEEIAAKIAGDANGMNSTIRFDQAQLERLFAN